VTPLDLSPLLILLIVVLASARLWRLCLVDKTSNWFAWVAGTALAQTARLMPKRWRGPYVETAISGLGCPYCWGWWLTLGTLSSALAWSDQLWWQIVFGALALNYAGGTLNAKLDAE
jgi:hypothetical protein